MIPKTPGESNFDGEILREVNEKLMIASIRQHELAEVATQDQQRLSALMNGIDAVICEISLKNGAILFLSEQAQSFLGYNRHEWNRRTFWRRVIHPDDRAAAFACFFRAVRSEQDYEHEFRVIASGGRLVWIRIRVVVVADARLMRCVILDVSTSKQAEEILAHSERRYRRLFEAARDGILLLDPNTGVIIDANPFMTELLGYSHGELIGKELWEIGLLRDKSSNRNAFQQLKRNHYIRYENLPLENRQGEQREVEFVSNLYRENGHTIIQCNIRDITERKRVAEELKATAAALEATLAREKHITEMLQRPMLYQPKEDAFSGLLVQTAYAMASEEALVGGDFWDTFAFDHGHVALVVGDVMGHGLDSAIFTTELKYAMRAYTREHEHPDRVLFHMNQFIHQSNRLFQEGINKAGNDWPVCLTLAVVERETGVGLVAAAGMESPVLVRASGDAEQLATVGMPLGIATSEEYKCCDFVLEIGDTLLLFTDGITEARQGQNFLDIEGLMELAVAGNGGTLKEMADTILNGAKEFAGGKLRDDASLVLVRRNATFHATEEK